MSNLLHAQLADEYEDAKRFEQAVECIRASDPKAPLIGLLDVLATNMVSRMEQVLEEL